MPSKNMITGVSVLAIAVSTAAAYGEESSGLTLVPSIGYQQKQLAFDQLYMDDVSKVKNENGRESHFRVYLPTINLSLTGSYNRFYVALKYEQSLAEGSVSVDETKPAARSALGDPYFLNVPDHDTRVKRNDESITVGVNVWQGLNVFMGYMEGKTKLTPTAACYTFPVPCTGRNLASDMDAEGRGEYHQVYTERGPYVGFSYGWQVENAGTLSFSYAHAQMDGRFSDNYITTLYGDEHFNFTGDSVGNSIGLTWSAPLGESSGYFIDLRQQKYSMHGSDDHTPSTYFDTVSVNTVETMRGLTMGLQFYF